MLRLPLLSVCHLNVCKWHEGQDVRMGMAQGVALEVDQS